MMSRRALLSPAPLVFASGASALAATPSNPAIPPSAKYPFDFVGPENDPEFGKKGVRRIGSGTPMHDEVATGSRLLIGAGKYDSPFAIARYFADLTETNIGGELYNREWETRANPVITGFMSLTHTKPNLSDKVHWCAAFVSFCLQASNRPSLLTAWAQSYRHYRGRKAIVDPRPGDLAVFGYSDGSGHVGFFSRWRTDAAGQKIGFMVLGGNQGGAAYGGGAVVERPFSRADLIGFYRVDD